MVLALVGVFSVGIFQSVMSLRDKSDATYYPLGYDFHANTAISNADYKDNTSFGISNAEGLKGFIASSVDRTWEGKNIFLNTDIDMGGYETSPIGAKDSWHMGQCTFFMGTFDGNWHTISNLKVKAPKDNGDAIVAGIFAKLGNCAIKEIRFYNCQVTNANDKSSEPLYMGIIAGSMTVETLIQDCVIDSCTINNTAKKVTNLYTSPTAGGCIDEYDLSNVYGSIGGGVYQWNSNLNLSFGGLIRVCVQNFTNNDSRGSTLGPEYVKFQIKYIANDGVGSKKTAYLAILNIKECVVGTSVAGSIICGVQLLGYDNNYDKNIYWYVGNGYAIVFEPIINYAYDDANDYSRLTVANETMDPSNYVWYRSAIAYNDTPYLVKFANIANIKIECDGSRGYMAYRDRWGNVRMDGQTSFYLYFPNEVYIPRHSGSVFWPFVSSDERIEAYAYTDRYCTFSRWDYAPTGHLTYNAHPTFDKLDTCVVSFKPAQNDNLYYDKNNTTTIKPRLFDLSGSMANPSFASISSDGSLNLVVQRNTDLYPDSTYPVGGYDVNNGGYYGVYTLNVSGTWYAVAYHFTEAVPNLTCTRTYNNVFAITSNLDITTTFNGGYVNLQFLTVNNTEISNPVGSIDDLQYEYRIPQNSQVSASVTVDNQAITYSINNEQKITYTCQNECKIVGTGLGNSSNLMANSETISTKGTIHKIYPIVNWNSDDYSSEPVPDPSGVTLRFNTAIHTILDDTSVGYAIYAVNGTIENKLGYNTKHLGLTITDRGEAVFNLEGVSSLNVEFGHIVNLENNPILNSYYYLVTVNDTVKYKVYYDLTTSTDEYVYAISTHDYNGETKLISSFTLGSENVQIIPIITLKSYSVVDGSKQ